MDEERLLLNNELLHSEISKLMETLLNGVSRLSVQPSLINSINSALTKLPIIIQEFEPSPQLLDRHLTQYIERLSALYLTVKEEANDKEEFKSIASGIADVVYAFAKIRGFKVITNYFSSDVYLVSKLLHYKERTDNSDNEHFLILLWLSTLVLVPFALRRVLSDFPERMYKLSLTNLTSYSNGSKNQIVSLILLSRLLTRPDQGLLLDRYMHQVSESWATMLPTTKLGHLITINKVMKRSANFNQFFYIIEQILKIDFGILAAQSNKSDFTNLNVLYLIKLSDRLCGFYLKKNEQRHFEFVAKVVNSLFHDILAPLENKFDSNLRYAMGRALSNICHSLGGIAMNYQEQVITYVLEEFGIPNMDLEEYSSNIIVSESMVSIAKYHTLLLTLGYLSLKKSLPHKFIPVVLSIVHKTLYFVQRKLTVTVGTQIRDSSCFIIWALFKNSTPFSFQYFSEKAKIDILLDILNVCIFDSDLVIRRCGNAVLQEYIGRFGSKIFRGEPTKIGKFIIEFIQLFDSSSVSTLKQSYRLILRLSEMGFDRSLFIPQLMDKISEGDLFEIKKLATKTLVMLMNTSNSTTMMPSDNEWTLDDILLELSIQILEGCDVGPLYATGKLVEGKELLMSQKSIVKSIKINFQRSHFNFHTDLTEKAEEFISFLVSTNKSTNASSLVFVKSHIFEILRLSHNDKIVHQLQMFFSSIQLPDEWWEYFFMLLRNNNLNIAESIGYVYDLPDYALDILLELVCDKMIQSETRALIQKSLSHYYSIKNIPNAASMSIVNLLDDYTTTVQGDVGSKVRRSTIELIECNLGCISDDLKLQVIPKLSRISAEPLSSLQIISFRVLLKLLGRPTKILELMYTTDRYYKSLIAFHRHKINEDCELAFWSGYVFSTSGAAASSSTINSSVTSLLEYLSELHPLEISNIVNILLRLLIPPSQANGGMKSATSRDLKRYIAALDLLIILLESHIISTDLLDFEKIYIRCYNLHINTNNLNRINLVLKVFQYLAPVLDRCLQRVCFLACQHASPTVRQIGGEILFEIANDMGHDDLAYRILKIKWDEPVSELKREQLTIQNEFR